MDGKKIYEPSIVRNRMVKKKGKKKGETKSRLLLFNYIFCQG
jgi:hypothetical protein